MKSTTRRTEPSSESKGRVVGSIEGMGVCSPARSVAIVVWSTVELGLAALDRHLSAGAKAKGAAVSSLYSTSIQYCNECPFGHRSHTCADIGYALRCSIVRIERSLCKSVCSLISRLLSDKESKRKCYWTKGMIENDSVVCAGVLISMVTPTLGCCKIAGESFRCV